MKLNDTDRVPSPDLCQELHDLGITKDLETERVWAKCVVNADCDRLEWEYNEEYVLHQWGIDDMREDEYFKSFELIPAPDLIELLELLPHNTQITKDTKLTSKTLYGASNFYRGNNEAQVSNTAPNAAALMAIKLRKQDV